MQLYTYEGYSLVMYCNNDWGESHGTACRELQVPGCVNACTTDFAVERQKMPQCHNATNFTFKFHTAALGPGVSVDL